MENHIKSWIHFVGGGTYVGHGLKSYLTKRFPVVLRYRTTALWQTFCLVSLVSFPSFAFERTFLARYSKFVASEILVRLLSGNILTASPTLTTKCFSTSGLPRQNQQEPFKGAKGKKSKYGQAFKSKARRSSKHLDQSDLKTARTERSQNESCDARPKNLVQIDKKLCPIKVNMIWRWGE